MSYAIDMQGTLDLVGNSAEYEFDVGVHVYTRFVYVARTTNGSVRLRVWKLEADGSFTSVGTEHVWAAAAGRGSSSSTTTGSSSSGSTRRRRCARAATWAPRTG